MRINDMTLNSRFGGSFIIQREKWTRDFLLVHFRTPAIVEEDGIEVLADEGSFILYHVGSPQHYYAAQTTYSDDFIHFDIDEDYNFLKGLNIPFNRVLHMPKAKIFSKILSNIQNEYISTNKYKELTLDLMLKQLLIKLSEFMENESEERKFLTYYDILQKLRTEIYCNPEKGWTVAQMAKYCNLSPSYLQTLYKQAFQTTCINDMINSKMQLAKSLLLMTQLPVKEVAIQCGYQNIEYFMRQFKKTTGHTPSEYRLHYK